MNRLLLAFLVCIAAIPSRAESKTENDWLLIFCSVHSKYSKAFEEKDILTIKTLHAASFKRLPDNEKIQNCQEDFDAELNAVGHEFNSFFIDEKTVVYWTDEVAVVVFTYSKPATKSNGKGVWMLKMEGSEAKIAVEIWNSSP